MVKMVELQSCMFVTYGELLIPLGACRGRRTSMTACQRWSRIRGEGPDMAELQIQTVS